MSTRGPGVLFLKSCNTELIRSNRRLRKRRPAERSTGSLVQGGGGVFRSFLLLPPPPIHLLPRPVSPTRPAMKRASSRQQEPGDNRLRRCKVCAATPNGRTCAVVWLASSTSSPASQVLLYPSISATGAARPETRGERGDGGLWLARSAGVGRFHLQLSTARLAITPTRFLPTLPL
jgi:hypothetical protein